jgi:hypothetical protein
MPRRDKLSVSVIVVPCEGSGASNHGYCPMCGRGTSGADPLPVDPDHEDVIAAHDRPDIIAMIVRGDFDARRREIPVRPYAPTGTTNGARTP